MEIPVGLSRDQRASVYQGGDILRLVAAIVEDLAGRIVFLVFFFGHAYKDMQIPVRRTNHLRLIAGLQLVVLEANPSHRRRQCGTGGRMLPDEEGRGSFSLVMGPCRPEEAALALKQVAIGLPAPLIANVRV